MATKSVGTLSAKLLLDTKGWTGGFNQAQRAAKQATSVGGFGSVIEKTALKFFAAEKIMRAVGRAFRATVKNFQQIEKTGGVGLTSNQVERVAAANKAVRELGKSLQAIADNASASLAPVVTVFANGINDAINRIESLGVTMASVSDTMLKAAFGWHVGFKLVNAELEATVHLLKLADATRRFLTGDRTAAVEAAGSSLKLATTQKGIADLLSGKGIADLLAGFTKGLTSTPVRAAEKAKARAEQTPHERGSLAAAQAVQALGGDAIKSVENNTARMLEQIKGLRADMKNGRKIVQAKI